MARRLPCAHENAPGGDFAGGGAEPAGSGFLQEDAALRLHQCLSEEVPWETAQRSDAVLAEGQDRRPPPGSAEDEAALAATCLRAREGFEF